MSLRSKLYVGALVTSVAALVVGCDDKPAPTLAPTATALTAEKPAPSSGQALTVDKATSKVGFEMEAPEEKIRGRSDGTTEGELHVDPADVTKTTGLLTVDIGNLEVYQTVAGKDGKPGAESKSDLQNEHARTWLQISPDAPEADRKKNAHLEFSIKSITLPAGSEKDLGKLTGADRKVTLTAQGEFLLHGHKASKTVELEATFHYEGDKLASVAVKTVKPFPVNLAEHDVKPRKKWDTFAEKTLEVLAPRVAKEALVSVEFTAKAGASAAPSADSSAKPGAP